MTESSEWWTRYQPVSYQLVSRSGTEVDFVDMVKRCQAVGVDIYVDAVINHMAAGSGTGVAGSPFGNRAFPGLYSAADMHHNYNDESSNCQVDFSSRTNIQMCDLLGLVDLNTGSSYTAPTITGYLKHLAQDGVAGIRVDAAKHIDSNELKNIVTPSKLFAFCEVEQDQFVSGYLTLMSLTTLNICNANDPYNSKPLTTIPTILIQITLLTLLTLLTFIRLRVLFFLQSHGIQFWQQCWKHV